MLLLFLKYFLWLKQKDYQNNKERIALTEKTKKEEVEKKARAF